MPKISSKHQITLPVDALREAGLREGDEVTVAAEGPDAIVVRRVGRMPEEAFGVFDGLYEPGYLDALRAGERA
jgi:bifunctional DNA-binding transcriptional regulator/antitoxin component of YhaV-PrlF toxin-antitoxin module